MKTLEPVLIVTPVLLALAMGIILFVFLYQRRMLQHQVQLRELQEQKQRQLLTATLQAQEEERRRVARDLHDDVGASLALVKLNVHQLVAPLGDKSKGQSIKGMLDDVIGNVRRISHSLMPVMLEKMGLPRALEAMKRSVPAESGTEMEFICNDNNRRMDPKLELSLYRVVQELLNNTLKHAKASKITIQLQFSENELLLTYADNGAGFDYKRLVKSEEKSSQGLGLMNLHARINLLNGTFAYNSALNSGTKAEIVVPIS
ncbi:signal transduction histidine kinase [Pontibacter aydingkolensis]|uniref:histidine kinase n=1 Tax=Pontibacter aydingkolensis TaxID=1911536 RepID=A0ABS7CZJ6_9BACT|nr:sensor histidine kinase [Pontibacter aydingkolensis]MBW7469298.1 sensor histidine kinase [Pontibacter aydingkolensis]